MILLCDSSLLLLPFYYMVYAKKRKMENSKFLYSLRRKDKLCYTKPALLRRTKIILNRFASWTWKPLDEREGFKFNVCVLTNETYTRVTVTVSLRFRLKSLYETIEEEAKRGNKTDEGRRRFGFSLGFSKMFLRSQNLWTVLLILGICSRISHSLHFDLHSGRTKCIAEDIKSNSMTVGKYNIDNPHEGQTLPPSHKISVKVRGSVQFWPSFWISIIFFLCREIWFRRMCAIAIL